jgi:molybdopterin molybdotransferase
MPGEQPAVGQIVCSNPFGVAAIVAAAGGTPRMIGIARDTRASLEALMAEAAGADIMVTLGGASVGDHDLVGPVLTDRGAKFEFLKIAMRPGKPMMFGRLGAQRVMGLPGNPVSSLVTARLFLVPLVRALLGLVPEPMQMHSLRLAAPVEANGARTHYMRATSERGADGAVTVRPVETQDSSLLTPLAAADFFILRPIGARALAAGEEVPVLRLDF